MKIVKKIMFCTLLLTAPFVKASAGSNSFQISPAPVPHPIYEDGQKLNRYNATYVEMEGSGLEISGGGLNLMNRQVLKNADGAVNIGGGLNFMSGDLKYSGVDGDLFVMAWNIQASYEKQILKEKYYSLIGFGGLNFPMFYNYFDVSVGTAYVEVNSFGYMYGIPFGFQGGLHPHKNWTLAPFISFNWILGGSVSVNTNTTLAGTTTSDSTTESIDSYLGYSFGMDIFYEPYNVGLGALFQIADGGGDAGEIETQILNISWKHEF